MPYVAAAKVRKSRNRLFTLAMFLLIPLILYILLFQVNRFSLEIRLLGQDELSVSYPQDYQEPGARAYLVGTLFARNGIPVDTEIRVDNQIDFQKPGTYSVHYDGIWRGLEASSFRCVTVLDITAPSITLISDPNHVTHTGEQYQEEGFSAWDDCDGDLTAMVVRTENSGYVTYTVSDRAGNQTTVSRKIHYLDTIPPELHLVGDSTIYLKSGTGYTEPGFTAMDNVDGDLNHWVKVSGTVDKYLAGTYQLIYTVKDDTGNSAEAVRTVVVEAVGVPQTITPGGRTIYLTFDDGPGPYTMELLNILDRYGVKATFFVVDSGHDDEIREIVRRGHAIAIHSVTHDYDTIYASAEAFFEDILSMQQIILDLTGVKTYLMRFPGGSSNTVSRFNPGIMSYLTQAVQDMGFQYFDWNVDSDDAGWARDPKTVFENVTEGVENNWASVVLQHDVKPYSVEAVEKIIQWGLENGYQFLPLDMTSPTSHHGLNN